MHQSNIVRAQEQAKTAARVAELEASHKDAVTQLEETERHIGFCEEFTRRKVAVIENHINGMFRHARFKLFREQINGELSEICDTTYEGVPFLDLNTAAKINIGLDIISTLSCHYGVSAPIFIDNAESVTELFSVDAQIIRLIVSENDNILRMETEEIPCQQTA